MDKEKLMNTGIKICKGCKKRFFDSKGDREYCSEKCREGENKRAEPWETIALRKKVYDKIKGVKEDIEQLGVNVAYNDVVEALLARMKKRDTLLEIILDKAQKENILSESSGEYKAITLKKSNYMTLMKLKMKAKLEGWTIYLSDILEIFIYLYIRNPDYKFDMAKRIKQKKK